MGLVKTERDKEGGDGSETRTLVHVSTAVAFDLGISRYRQRVAAVIAELYGHFCVSNVTLTCDLEKWIPNFGCD